MSRPTCVVGGAVVSQGVVMRTAACIVRALPGEATPAPRTGFSKDTARQRLESAGQQAALALRSTPPEQWGRALRELQSAYSNWLAHGGTQDT